MFGTWSASTWVILIVDVVAVVIVVLFLKSKIQHKIREVEARQAHERLQQKRANQPDDEAKPRP